MGSTVSRHSRRSGGAAGGSTSSAREHVPDPNSEEVFSDVKTVFSYARHGHQKIVERCLQNSFDPDLRDDFGNTLFHICCQNGNKKIAKLAIKYGGNMDARNARGNTGLHFLFAYGYQEVAEYFISKGADPQVKNDFGLTCRQGLKA